MKRTRILAGAILVAAATLPTATALAGETLVWEKYYGPLHAHQNYTTRWQRIAGGPQHVKTLRVMYSGNYCNLVSHGLEYSRKAGGPAHTADSVDGSRYRVNDTVAEFKYDYEQSYWTGVSCRIKVYAITADDGDDGNEGPNGLERKARMLSIDANLFSSTMSLTDGYGALTEPARGFADSVDQLQEALDNDAPRRRLAVAFRVLEKQWGPLKRQFYRVHAEVLDDDAEASWLNLRESYRAVAAEFE